MELIQHPHDRLLLHAFVTQFSDGITTSPDWLTEMLHLEADTPVRRHEEIRKTIRDMLRLGGYKPTGRGKPASEYLIRAATEGYLSSINQPVDVCNVVSLHSGIPISVVDLNKTAPPLHVAQGGEDTTYVFNASGQEIKVAGLLCLFDSEGPCANGVKDAQRSKTSESTTTTLSLLWSDTTLMDHTQTTLHWYHELLGRLGATITPVAITAP